MISLRHVNKYYNDLHAVNDVTLSVQNGEKHVLIGTSGSGKSTLLKMINKIIPKSSGTIEVDGLDTDKWDENELRRRMGYVIQDVGLFPHYTIAQNIGILPGILKWRQKDIATRVEEMMEMVGLPERILALKPSALSGGQQQRVGIARALAVDPQVLLMDEPFGALDPITRSDLQAEFRNLKGIDQKTIVLVTHDMLEAALLGEKITLLDHGKVMQTGTLQELLFKPASPLVSGFFQTQRDQLERLAVRVSALADMLPVNEVTESLVMISPDRILADLPAEGYFTFELNGRKYLTSKSECLAVYYRNRDLVISKCRKHA